MIHPNTLPHTHSAIAVLSLHGERTVRWIAKKADKPLMGTVDSLSVERVSELMKLNEDGWDLYYVPNPVKEGWVGVKPGDKDIVEYKYFVVDIDPLDGAQQQYTALQDALFNTAWGPWNYIVFTGRGFQLFHRVGDEYDHKEVAGIRRRVESFLRNRPDVRQYGFRVDTTTSDASRMVRFPFTVNWKTGERGWARHLSTYSTVLPEPFEAPPAPVPFDFELTELSRIAPRLTAVAERYLLRGINSNIQSRHAAAYAAAACLRDLGVNRKHAEGWVLFGAEICQPPLDPKDAMHCVRTAYNKTGPS